jgi:hypothetical protein
MQVGNGAEDASDLLSYLLWYIIYWGIVDILPHSEIPGWTFKFRLTGQHSKFNFICSTVRMDASRVS